MKKRIKSFFYSKSFLINVWNTLEVYRYLSTYITYKILLKHNPEKFIKNLYKKYTNEYLNLENPKTFNEKLQWLKLYWYDKRATICADKLRVREYVTEKGLKHILNELIAVYDKSSKINLTTLPKQFVLKPNHDSEHTLICRDKDKVNWKREFKKLDYWLSINYSFMSGEWPYRDIKPRIICEKFLEDEETNELLDYKFFCFNGEPKVCRVIFFENGQHKSNFYDMNWNFIKKWQEYPYSKKRFLKKPENFDEMKEIAKILSDTFPHVRVDLYNINGKIIFGELTFFTTGGFGYFSPKSFNNELGSLIELPKKSNPWNI